MGKSSSFGSRSAHKLDKMPSDPCLFPSQQNESILKSINTSDRVHIILKSNKQKEETESSHAALLDNSFFPAQSSNPRSGRQPRQQRLFLSFQIEPTQTGSFNHFLFHPSSTRSERGSVITTAMPIVIRLIRQLQQTSGSRTNSNPCCQLVNQEFGRKYPQLRLCRILA